MTMISPNLPEGVNELIEGFGAKVNPFASTVPPVVLTKTLPLAPAATTAFTV